MTALVLDLILNTVFHKAQFCVHYLLILIWLTYFMNAKKMIMKIILTTQLPIRALLTFPLSFLNYKQYEQKFFIVLAITLWMPIQVNVTYYLILKVLKLYLLMEHK